MAVPIKSQYSFEFNYHDVNSVNYVTHDDVRTGDTVARFLG